MYPANIETRDEIETWPEVLSRGGSAIYGPLGEALAGPLWDDAGVIYADLDLTALPRSRFDFDVTGHYARPDVFTLNVNEAPQRSREGADAYLPSVTAPARIFVRP